MATRTGVTGTSDVRIAVLFGAVATTGLGAGLFYSYACSVTPGLARADDRTFVEAMRRLNEAILNGWFMLSFLGSLALIVLAAVLQWHGGGRSVLLWIGAAAAFQLAMLVITGVVNVPLNNKLAAAGSLDDLADLAAARSTFESTWIRWNLVRALTSTASFACISWALVLSSRTPASD
ncbi:anthrone oxygenase family protein [Streptomyces mashuensis]|nr:anthrone oxygenase family protein [Streptomyces mashuensis]